MEIYHMADIISLLGLPRPPHGKSSYYIPCPCCDEKPRAKHLNINLQKDVFRCPRCGISGGIFDLYSIYTGVSREKVKKDLDERLGPVVCVERPKQKIVPPTIQEYPMTDIETRHATYEALLSALSLAPDHKDNLLSRGLSEQDILRLGYKTTPVVGTTALAKHLQNKGFYLAGVPGFFRNESDSWTFVHDQRGILIPVRNKDGLIQGLQIRRDNVTKRKFRWASSADRKDGCRAEGWIHLAGSVRAVMILTEGPMKADVIHALSGLSVVAVPGVNALTQLRSILEQLRAEGLQEIKIAFDMDFFTNCHVQNGYNSLLSLLDEMGFLYGTYVWDPRYNGLDNYIWEHCLQRKRPQ